MDEEQFWEAAFIAALPASVAYVFKHAPALYEGEGDRVATVEATASIAAIIASRAVALRQARADEVEALSNAELLRLVAHS